MLVMLPDFIPSPLLTRIIKLQNTMQNRETNGQYGNKKMPTIVKIILALIIITAVVAPAISSQLKAETVIVPDAPKKVDLNSELQALIEKKTQEAMKDPKNIQAYHDEVERRINNAINTLTGTL